MEEGGGVVREMQVKGAGGQVGGLWWRVATAGTLRWTGPRRH